MQHKLRWFLEGATTPVAENADGTVTLADNSTYYAELGGMADEALLGSVEFYWTSLVSVASGLSIEKTNHPEVHVSTASGSTSKWHADAVTALAPAGNGQGRCILSAPDAARYRAKCTVGASAGNGGNIEGRSIWKIGR